MTKQRPIIFNTETVRAILDGRKTQTRRIVKPLKDKSFGCKLNPNEIAGEVNNGDLQNCTFGNVGDQLWVRETWCLSINEDGHPINKDGDLSENKHAEIFYRATPVKNLEAKWCPSIHMPKWASRIMLEVANVRIERLNDISKEDAKAEGCDYPAVPGMGWKLGARHNFRWLWNSIYNNWNDNPWVWVIEFKVISVKG